MSANLHCHLIRWLSSFVRQNLRASRANAGRISCKQVRDEIRCHGITAACRGTRTARPGKAVGLLASVYTVRFFWIGACPWMTKTIARCSRRMSVRAAPAGVSAATATRSNWPRSAA
ncbi:hypothetical protein FCJ61_02850 [Burkholderia metallica]|nr:hypothetical protein [Burkholderia metallica]